MACSTCDNPEYWSKFKTNLDAALDVKFKEYDANIAKVRDELIHSTFASHKTEINDIKLRVSDLNVKIQSIEGIENFVDAKSVASEQKAIRTTITQQKDYLNSVESSRENFVKFQLLQNSIREQRCRDWSCRIVNFQQPWSRENITEFIIFRNIIRPTLEAALKRGELEYIPSHFCDIVERAHMLPYTKGQIPVFIFRFMSRSYLDAWMNNKKAVLDRYNAEIKRFNPRNNASPVPFFTNRLVQAKQDMSDLNRKTMTFVYATNQISRAKVAGQHVQFQLKNGSRWIRCLNPFGKDLKEMAQPIPGSEDFFLSEAPPILCFNKLAPEERKTFFSNQADLTEDDFPRQFSTITAHPSSTIQHNLTSAPAPALGDLAVFPPIDSAATVATAAHTAVAPAAQPTQSVPAAVASAAAATADFTAAPAAALTAAPAAVTAAASAATSAALAAVSVAVPAASIAVPTATHTAALAATSAASAASTPVVDSAPSDPVAPVVDSAPSDPVATRAKARDTANKAKQSKATKAVITS